MVMDYNDRNGPLTARDTAELLECCNQVGTIVTGVHGQHFEKGRYVLQYVQDLHRQLRYDSQQTQGVKWQLGHWNILPGYLIPLLKDNWESDTKLTLAVIKLMYLLTSMPRPENFSYDDQISHCLSSKKAFAHTEVVSNILHVLIPHLSPDESEEEDDTKDKHQDIVELILMLVRNLLIVPSPCGDATIHDDLLLALQESNFLELVTTLCNGIELEYRKWSMLLLEIVYGVLHGQAPHMVLEAEKREKKPSDVSTSYDDNRLYKTTDKKVEVSTENDAPKSRLELLRLDELEVDRRDKEKRILRSRHSKFGGSFAYENALGNSYVYHKPHVNFKKKLMVHSKKDVAWRRAQDHRTVVGDSSDDSMVVVAAFAREFIAECYNTMMGVCAIDLGIPCSMDRGSRPKVKHVETDMHTFLFVMHFHMKFHRLVQQHVPTKLDISMIGRTIDKDLVIHIFDQVSKFHELLSQGGQKNRLEDRPAFSNLRIALDAFDEIVRYVTILATHESEDMRAVSTTIVACILYEPEYLDIWSSLVTKLSPRAYPKSYIKDLIRIFHGHIKMLQFFCKNKRKVLSRRRKHRRSRKSNTNKEDEEDTQENVQERERQILEERAANEVEFELEKYVHRFAHPEVIELYIRVLEDYRDNGLEINHCIIKYLYRISVEHGMRPMLYQLSVFNIFNRILNDEYIENLREFDELRLFIKYIVGDFMARCQACPVSFVEMLFWKKSYEASDEVFWDPVKRASAGPQKRILGPVSLPWSADEDINLREAFIELSVELLGAVPMHEVVDRVLERCYPCDDTLSNLGHSSCGDTDGVLLRSRRQLVNRLDFLQLVSRSECHVPASSRIRDLQIVDGFSDSDIDQLRNLWKLYPTTRKGILEMMKHMSGEKSFLQVLKQIKYLSAFSGHKKNISSKSGKGTVVDETNSPLQDDYKSCNESESDVADIEDDEWYQSRFRRMAHLREGPEPSLSRLTVNNEQDDGIFDMLKKRKIAELVVDAYSGNNSDHDPVRGRAGMSWLVEELDDACTQWENAEEENGDGNTRASFTLITVDRDIESDATEGYLAALMATIGFMPPDDDKAYWHVPSSFSAKMLRDSVIPLLDQANARRILNEIPGDTVMVGEEQSVCENISRSCDHDASVLAKLIVNAYTGNDGAMNVARGINGMDWLVESLENAVEAWEDDTKNPHTSLYTDDSDIESDTRGSGYLANILDYLGFERPTGEHTLWRIPESMMISRLRDVILPSLDYNKAQHIVENNCASSDSFHTDENVAAASSSIAVHDNKRHCRRISDDEESLNISNTTLLNIEYPSNIQNDGDEDIFQEPLRQIRHRKVVRRVAVVDDSSDDAIESPSKRKHVE